MTGTGPVPAAGDGNPTKYLDRIVRLVAHRLQREKVISESPIEISKCLVVEEVNW